MDEIVVSSVVSHNLAVVINILLPEVNPAPAYVVNVIAEYPVILASYAKPYRVLPDPG